MFRILALDGGGIKGVFTAAVLSALEDESGQRIVDHFALIAGTSTGGIIAIGIALGLSGKALLDFYTRRGPTIFPHTSLTVRTSAVLRWMFAPKHSHNVLKLELTNVLGTRKFGDAKTRLVIPTYDAVAGRIYI